MTEMTMKQMEQAALEHSMVDQDLDLGMRIQLFVKLVDRYMVSETVDRFWLIDTLRNVMLGQKVKKDVVLD